MPTREPRVAVTLPKEIKDIYQATASSMGTSMSKLAAQILIEAAPSVRELDLLFAKTKTTSGLAKGLSELGRRSNEQLQTEAWEIIQSSDNQAAE